MKGCKYTFQSGGDTDFFNQLADSLIQQQQGEPDEAAPQQPLVEDPNAGYDSDYEDLSQKYSDLQDQFNQLSSQMQPNMGERFDDGFLNFLFSDDKQGPIDFDNDPDFSELSAGSAPVNRSNEEVNPHVRQNHDLFNQYGLYSKGVWGDEAHQQRQSDHNSADAEDFGFNDSHQADEAVARLQHEAAQRGVKYIIYNKKIWNPEISNEWRPYNGPNPHTDHIHVSYKKYQAGGATVKRYTTPDGVRHSEIGLSMPAGPHPIVVNDPNDPRLKAYKDSLLLYNTAEQGLKWANAHGKQVMPYSTDIQITQDNIGNDYAVLNGQKEWVFVDPDARDPKKYLNSDYDALGHNYSRIKNINPIGGSMFKTEEDAHYGSSSIYPTYKKPTQPVVYQQPPPAHRAFYTKNVKGDELPTAQGFQAPQFSGQSNIAGRPQSPTDYSYSYRDDQGQQATKYFNDWNSWNDFVQTQPFIDAPTNAAKTYGHATGHYLKHQAGGPVNIDSTLNANRQVPFVDRIINADHYPVRKNPDGSVSTHLMAWGSDDQGPFVYPTLRLVGSKWVANTDAAAALKAGDYIRFPNDEQADYFSQHYKDSKLSKIKHQSGGVAYSHQMQYEGLNNPAYDHMVFPMQGHNTFRGLDSGEPVYLTDERGKQAILHNQHQTTSMFGKVREIRLK